MDADWVNRSSLTSISYQCGFCENKIASNQGFFSRNYIPGNSDNGYIYICPLCEQPTYFCDESRTPAVAPGNNVAEVPSDVDGLYVEARRCISVGAFTASVLASRKLLMNIAVTQGANAGQSFVQYVEFLSSSGYVPPHGRGWVDHIRKRGNEATHEIPAMTEADATELITFIEMLLKFIYEFPAKVPAAKPDEHA
ncbi:DUF4145 domain-containing protein [Oricola indica]|uniref:DUF4145 domain-containing protein n=1 Tax=Oricola indica TaxID=2872591 RepID=UPI001CBCDED9|nr:DUF4145 domain-containing protein [Oricola indica]